jgi:hypothetical protein
MTWYDKYCNGLATLDDISNYVDDWHKSGDEETRELHEYLGLTEEQYDYWLLHSELPEEE